MADDLEKRVKAAYRRHFEDTRKSSDAWNRTLADVVGNYDPDAPEEQHRLQETVVQILRKITREVEVDAGDPFALAVEAALRDLRGDKAAEEVQADWRRYDKDRRERIRDEKKLRVPEGPKEWTPNKDRKEKELERAVERERENDPDDSTLYIMFNQKGALQGWKIDYPSYWPGHSGPVATVSASDTIDYDEIRDAIEEALHYLDWEGIEEKLEQEEGEDA